MSLLPGAGEGGNTVFLLPCAGEGGRRPDEGGARSAVTLHPHPPGPRHAGPERPLPEPGEVTPSCPFSPAEVVQLLSASEIVSCVNCYGLFWNSPTNQRFIRGYTHRCIIRKSVHMVRLLSLCSNCLKTKHLKAARPLRGRGDNTVFLLPCAGEGGRRPDEGGPRSAVTLHPHPPGPRHAGPERPLPEPGEVTPSCPFSPAREKVATPCSFSPAREKVAEGRMRGPAIRRHAPPSPARAPPRGPRATSPGTGRGANTVFLLPGAGEGANTVFLLPGAGEGGRRPDEGAPDPRRAPIPPDPRRSITRSQTVYNGRILDGNTSRRECGFP